MDRLELLVRDTLAEHAADAPDISTLHAPGRPTRRWLAAGVAAAAVAALAIGVVILRPSTDHRSSAAPATTSQPTSTRSPSPSQAPGPSPSESDGSAPALCTTSDCGKPVSYHGIQIVVPSTLPVRLFDCEQFATSEVLAVDPDFVVHCPFEPPGHAPADLVRVELLPSGPLDATLQDLSPTGPAQPVEVDGVTATTQYGTSTYAPGVTAVLTLSKPAVTVVVTTPSRARTAAIVATVSITPVDRLGCPGAVDSTLPSGNPDSSVLIPGHPTWAAVCRFARTRGDESGAAWLAASSEEPASTVPDLMSDLNELTTRPSSYRGGLIPENSWLVLHYADGSVRILAFVNNGTPTEVTDGHLVATDPTTTLFDLG